MNSRRLIRNNLVYYWKKHLLLALGVAISGAVITGALLVGDSVQYSLGRIVEQRLGEVSHVLKAGDRYFTSELSQKVADDLDIQTSALLLQEGAAVGDGGKLRVNQVQVLGVDQHFDRVTGLEESFSTLSGDTVIISRNLARRLNKSEGDDLLLRIEKASLIPLNAPFVSDAEQTVSVRAVIKDIVDEGNMGRFNLKVSQTAPFNVFISLSRLQQVMDFQGRVNVLLLADDSQRSSEDIMEVIGHHFSLADAGLKMTMLEELSQLQLTSERVFIEKNLAGPLEGIQDGEGLITYFVNSFSHGEQIAPYSFVSTLVVYGLEKDEIVINSWLADDLGVGPGDTIGLSWFEVGPLRELTEQSSDFVVSAIVPMEGHFADASVMPDIPGLSDAGNCRDWDTGVPIKLESIRDKDEDYWDEHGGLPKAYISLDRAREIWENRFGVYTSIRYNIPGAGDAGEILKNIETLILERINPEMLGFTLEASREKGDQAAVQGVDFTELFAGLSFFLLLAGVILIILLFLLNIESREDQLATLVTMGIPSKLIRRVLFIESLFVALTGALLGLWLAVFYNRLVFSALNGIWKDVVRTEMMHVDVNLPTLLKGLAITLFIALLAFWFPLRRKLARLQQRHSHLPVSGKKRGRQRKGRLSAVLALISAIIAIALIISQIAAGQVINSALFFPAGGLLLMASVFGFSWYLGKKERPSSSGFSLAQLSGKNATRMRTRSMSIVILFAIGAFLVISTGSNRKDLFANAEDPTSGTGGFLYYAQSTLPVLQKLDDPKVRYEYALEEEYSFVQMRLADGDDASCLNLNKIVSPRVLGVEAGDLEGRFSFVTRTVLLDEDHPWSTLQMELPGGLIPAIADETVIKYGLGMKVGDTLRYTNSAGGSMELLLVGGLAPSVFQGSVIISGDRFLEQYPESSGTFVFLLDGARADTAQIAAELSRGMRDLGWDMQLCSERLAEFNSVTNAYLSIFMVLGALGLLLGTFGLLVVLSRSILERKQEIALLKAVGYSRSQIRKLLSREYLFLLFWGILSGFGAAIIASLPSILSTNTGTSFSSILIWLMILVVNGWFWIAVLSAVSLRNPRIYEGLRNE